MEKNDFQCHIHTWMEKTVKKAIVYNTKRETGKKKKRKDHSTRTSPRILFLQR